MSSVQIRSAQPDDLEAIVDLETRSMHFPMGHRVREWFRGDHPSVSIDHFAVADVDGRIVAAAGLLRRPLAYRGIAVAACEWEAVATEAEFRRRGLCRQLFSYLESRCDADVLMVHGLTWLYRRFGYHPALASNGDWDAGGHLIHVERVAESTLGVRPAIEADAPFLVATRAAAMGRSVVTVPATVDEWRHELRPDRSVVGRGGTSLNRWQAVRILLRGDEAVGYFIHDPWDLACLAECEIVANRTTWQEAGAATVRSTAAFAKQPFAKVMLAANHPLLSTYAEALSEPFRAYGDWAVRLTHPARWLMRVAAVLESMLSKSPMAGWSGAISISRIADAFTLELQAGRLADVKPWTGWRADEADARFMPGRFEAMAFGYRSLDAILQEDADCAVKSDEHAAVLRALFPPGASSFRFF